MNFKISQKSVVLSISILFFFTLLCVAKTYQGTGDEGDSVMHFLFSKYAFKHPHHFFHHWAKPFYVLLTCLPAQFDFFGIQAFNILLNAISIYLSFNVAKKLNIKYAWLAALFLAIFPHQIIYSLSGLTEPLFAFILITIIYLWISDKKIISLLLLSFLPFVRSEGLVVMVVFFIYLLVKKEWKMLPLFLVGNIVYAFLGNLFFDKPLLWVINENPYAVGATSYGSGPWDTFINNIRFSTGIVLYYILAGGMLLGLVYTILKYGFNQTIRFSLEELFLVYGVFFSVFFFHSFAWYKGLFHSFGLIRVMVGVLPLIAIICAKFMNEIILFIPDRFYKQNIFYAFLICIVIANFSVAKYAVTPERDLSLRGDQKCQNEIAEYIWQHHKDYYKTPIYYAAPYISVVLERDYFDYILHPDLNKDFHSSALQKPCYILWDDWYAPVESNVKQEEIEAYPGIKKIKKFWHWDITGNKDRVTILYKLE